eukprot:5116706-Heterocapsa_arctica.AAC.1
MRLLHGHLARVERSNAKLFGADVTPEDRHTLDGVREERSKTARDAAIAVARLAQSEVRKRAPEDPAPGPKAAPY